MSVTIKYKGNTIASANTDTTKTLQTSGKYCEGDILVENVQDGGITPSGTLPITENGTYDVTEYAEAEVNVSGGGIPFNWEVDSGTFTLASDFVGNYTINHSLGKVPTFVCYYSNDREHFPQRGTYFIGGWWGDLLSSECLMMNALVLFGLDIHGWTLLNTYAQRTGYLYLNNSNIQYINKDRAYIENITSTSFDLNGVSTGKIPANVEFEWRAVYINEVQ